MNLKAIRAALVVAATIALIQVPTPVMAIDWLGNHLETQRANRHQDHQNRMRQAPARKPQPRTGKPRAEQKLTPAQQARMTERYRNFIKRRAPEYHRRVKSSGQIAADRWLKQQSYEFGAQEARRLKREMR